MQEKQNKKEPVKPTESFCFNKISQDEAKANKKLLDEISELLIKAGVGGSKCLLISSEDFRDLRARLKYLIFELE